MFDPDQALQQLLQPGGLRATLFPPASRYSGIGIATLETPDGKTITYIRRRFCPLPERFALLREYLVAQGDRMDTIAANSLGDPEQFWRIGDANAAMRPESLAEIGRRLRITLPEGVAGMQNA